MGLTGAEAERVAGQDADHHRRDLYESIDKGNSPTWTLSMQLMPYNDAKTARTNPFDLTKTWSHLDYPLVKVGTMTLNRNPENFFATGSRSRPSTRRRSSRGSGSRRTRCCSGGPSPTATPPATGSARTTVSCLSTGLAWRTSTPLRRTARWPTTTTGTLRSTPPTAGVAATAVRCGRRPVRGLRRDGGRAPARWRHETRARAGFRLLEKRRLRHGQADRGSRPRRPGWGQPGGDAEDAKVVNEPLVESTTHAAR